MSANSALQNQPWTLRVLQQGAESPEAKRIRLDSWANVLSGIGTSRDKSTSMLPYAEPLLSAMLLEVLYSTSDIAALIVTGLPDEAFKRPFKVVSKAALNKIPQAKKPPKTALDRDKERMRVFTAVDKVSTPDEAAQCAALAVKVKENGLHKKGHEAMCWGRLYGLGAILMGIDDGNPMWMPVDKARVRGISFMTVLDKRDLVPWRWYSDISKPKFGEVALYQVQPVGVFIGGLPYDPATNTIQIVHESRLMKFGGELTPKREKLRNQGSDYSVLQKCFRALQLVENNWQSVATLLSDASQGVFKIAGLMDMISEEPETMNTRMELVDRLRSTIRAIVLDKDGEDFERVSTPLTGLADILKQSWLRISSAARMPVTKFMGDSPTGMDATGEGDEDNWYANVAGVQERDLKPLFEEALAYEAQGLAFDDPDNWTVVFAPLYQMSEAEQAKMHLDQSGADIAYIGAGVVSEHEVALSRFGGGEYSLDTQIDVGLRHTLMEMDREAVQAEAANALETAKNPPDPIEMIKAQTAAKQPLQPQPPQKQPPASDK